MASTMSTTPLTLSELRKEQRRLAALLNRHDKASKIPKYPLHEVPPFWAWCSHTDPDGKYRNPALDFLRQGLDNLNNKSLLELAESMSRKRRLGLNPEPGKDEEMSDSGYSQVVDALVTSRRDSKRKSLTQFRYTRNTQGTNLFGGKGRPEKTIKGKDIEKFAYSNLKKPISLTEDELDDELRELGLSELRGDGRKHDRGFLDGPPYRVPENTIVPSTARSRDTEISLPSIHNGGKGGLVNRHSPRAFRAPENTTVNVANRRRGGNYAGLSDGPMTTREQDKPESRSKKPDNGYTISGSSQEQGHSQKTTTDRGAGVCVCSSPTLLKSTVTDTSGDDVPCQECGGGEGHDPRCSLATSANGRRRCARCGLATQASVHESVTDGRGQDSQLMISGSRQNTKVSMREQTLLSVRETTNDFRRQRDRTDLSSPFVRARTMTECSDDSVSMKEIEGRLRDISEKKTLFRLPSEDSMPAVQRVKWSQELDITEDPPSYMSKLAELENERTSGSLEVIKDNDAPAASQSQSSDRSAWFQKSKKRKAAVVQVYKDASREAYDKALAAAASTRLPDEPWMYSCRLSHPFKFSYFENIPRKQPFCPGCDNPVGKAEKADLKLKKPEKEQKKVKPLIEKTPRINEMKHIFGSIDINDYYPGGKKNPLVTPKADD